MRWPWRRRRDPDPADRAIAESREQRKAAEGNRAEVISIADTLRQIRQVNHLAEKVRNALGEGS